MSEREDSVAGDACKEAFGAALRIVQREFDCLAARCEELERELTEIETDRRYQQDRARKAERERDEERERFGRHVETMIEPKLLAPAEAAESLLEEAKEVLYQVDGFNDEVLREWRMEGDTKMCAEHIRQLACAFLAKLEAR